ncbi:MAG: hypothetical protein ACTSUF_02865 [Candidatus Heimdallarchaeaceae archaeon]
MIKKRQLIFGMVFVIMSVAAVPHLSQAKILYSYYNSVLTPTSSDVYLVLYDKDTLEREIVLTREIYARQCMQTPTEFRTVEMDDALITKVLFSYGTQNYVINYPDAVQLDNYVYMVAAANDTKTHDYSFFISYSNDSGDSWSDIKWIYNTTLSAAEFLKFDSVVMNNQLYIYYSYNVSSQLNTNVTIVDLPSLTVSAVETTGDYFGEDFELYVYDDKLYVVSTDPVNPSLLRFAYSTNGLDLSLQQTRITPPEQNVTHYNPTLTRWKNGFFIIAEDQHWAVIQQKELGEIFLWGFWIEDVGKENTMSAIHKLGSSKYDGYYEKDASVTVVNGQLFVSCTQDKSSQSQQGYPNIAFFFSTDGVSWTHQFMGTYSLITNPGIIFAIATVGVFIVTLPTVVFLQKRKK